MRQSLLARFDDCELSAKFDLESPDFASPPQARGILFHRFAAEALRVMRREREPSIPTEDALAIFYDVLAQRNVPPDDRVSIPLREVATVRTAVIKWAHDNEFDVERIVDIERRLYAVVRYRGADGGERTATLSGQLDVLVADPPDGAIIVDWKVSWGVPPLPRDPEAEPDGKRHLSYGGYFQQRFYALLVLANYPSIQRVQMREFYPLLGAVRAASVNRTDMEHLEQELGALAGRFAEAKATGTWPASPGKHCSFCLRPGDCPIPADSRGHLEGRDAAEAAAARYVVLTEERKRAMESLKGWVDANGPLPVRSAKGRAALGWREGGTGRRTFGVYVPEESDRGSKPPDLTEDLETAVRAEAERHGTTLPE